MGEMSIEVPPLATTALTGYIGAGEREIRSATWRVELYAVHPKIRILRNGNPVEWSACSVEARRFINRTVRTFNQANALAAQAAATQPRKGASSAIA